MSADRVFVDSNVLVYAYDSDAGIKHEVAKRHLAELWNDQTGALSIQVLQEFYVTVTAKLPTPITKRAAGDVIDTYDTWSPHRPTTADLIAASELEERHSPRLLGRPRDHLRPAQRVCHAALRGLAGRAAIRTGRRRQSVRPELLT